MEESLEDSDVDSDFKGVSVGVRLCVSVRLDRLHNTRVQSGRDRSEVDLYGSNYMLVWYQKTNANVKLKWIKR